MADIVYTGRGDVDVVDTRYVKWVGKTKGGHAIQIEFPKAICLSNPDWGFEEKNDTTPEVEFSALYEDEKLEAGDLTEPWILTMPDGMKPGPGEILLGVGRVYIGKTKEDATKAFLTRGGGRFTVERTYREINADDDPGPVEGRIHKSEARPKLKFTMLQWLSRVSDLYACIDKTEPAAAAASTN